MPYESTKDRLARELAERLKKQSQARTDAKKSQASKSTTPSTVKTAATATAIGANAIADLAIGLAEADTIKQQGNEAVRNIASLGLNARIDMKNIISDMTTMSDNARLMISEVHMESAKAQANLAVNKAESGLSGTSKAEADAAVSVESNEDEGNIRAIASAKRSQAVRSALGVKNQLDEDIESILSSMITEKEVIARGVVRGLNSAASGASMYAGSL